jgi:hypothetical protein
MNNKGIIKDKLLNEQTLEIAAMDGKPTFIITPEWDVADDAKRLLELARLILRTDEESPFRIEQSRPKNSKRIGKTMLGKRIHNALKTDIHSIRRVFHKHEFHPFLKLIIKEADDRMLFERYRDIDFAIDSEATKLVEIANDMVKCVRKIGRSTAFQNKVRIFERKSKDNGLQFNRYIDAHFKKRSRLLFVRLDFGYTNTFVDAVDRDNKKVYARLKKDWSALLRDLNLKILKDKLRGFVWKLEYGLKKSFHLHVLLIIDNSQIRSDIIIAKIIGEHWEKIVTGNRGDYFNCNAKKDSYRFCGIGQVHRDNAEMRQVLSNQVGAYITKPDYVISLEAPGGGRTFGKGKMPK